MANAAGEGPQGREHPLSQGRGARPARCGQEVADANGSGLSTRRHETARAAERPEPQRGRDLWGCDPWTMWEAEPAVGRVVDGLAPELDRARSHQLRMTGNGVVPQQAALAWRLLWPRVMELLT